jgi:Arc/MetJ-type ribon-helix-helix transcriptional regulator
MIGGMTTSKIAVSLPKPLVARARRAVRQGAAASVSAYLAAALEEKAKLDDLAGLLEEMLAETGGALTAGERRAADKALGIRRKRSPRVA